MKWVCCQCGIQNDFQYKCSECGALNTEDYVCSVCGALNDPDNRCKSCGHEMCDDCNIMEDDFEMNDFDSDDDLLMEEDEIPEIEP